MQTLSIIIGILYSTIGLISGGFAVREHLKKIKEDENNKQKLEDKIGYQIKDINDTLKNHEIEDKEMKEFMKKIEQEQENQNIKIAELHTKMDLICKASNINNKINKEDKKGNR